MMGDVRDRGWMTKARKLTLLKNLENGRPLSLANDQAIREDVATKPMVAQVLMTMIMETMAVVPGIDLVAWVRISIKGYLVGDFFKIVSKEFKLELAGYDTRASSIFPRQNRRASSIAKPKAPLMRTLVKIARGTFREALWISSDIYEEHEPQFSS